MTLPGLEVIRRNETSAESPQKITFIVCHYGHTALAGTFWNAEPKTWSLPTAIKQNQPWDTMILFWNQLTFRVPPTQASPYHIQWRPPLNVQSTMLLTPIRFLILDTGIACTLFSPHMSCPVSLQLGQSISVQRDLQWSSKSLCLTNLGLTTS